MIPKAFTRGCIALGTFWIGLHVIGIALWQSGNTGPRNMAWRLFQSVWTLEVSVLKLAFLLLVAIILMLFIFELTDWVFQKESKCDPINPPKNSAEPVSAIRQIMIPNSKQDGTAVMKVVATHTIKPQPAPLTAVELKRQALKQITGKEYLK
jgi:hypothetical protein